MTPTCSAPIGQRRTQPDRQTVHPMMSYINDGSEAPSRSIAATFHNHNRCKMTSLNKTLILLLSLSLIAGFGPKMDGEPQTVPTARRAHRLQCHPGRLQFVDLLRGLHFRVAERIQSPLRACRDARAEGSTDGCRRLVVLLLQVHRVL